MAYQRAYLPMETINITQGYGQNSSTHKNGYQIDNAGKDSGRDDIYAPFDCKVSKLYVKKGHAYEVWLTSLNKVLCSNGVYDYLTMSITHPEEISRMKSGAKYKQGMRILTEGHTGTSSGNHAHIELSIGKKAGWDKINGDYVNVNRIKPEDHLFAYDYATIKNETYKGKKYHFKKEKEMIKVVNVKDSLNVHKTCDTKSSSIIGSLANGTQAIAFKTVGSMTLIYSHSLLGYVASKYLK